MDDKYLDMAFADLDIINEDVPFEVKSGKQDDDVWDDLLDFENEEEEKEPEIAVSDEEAETEEEVGETEDYIGKIVLSCVSCGENIFKNEDEITEDEESGLCCVGETCPNCASEKGYKKIGKVVPLEDDEEEIEEPEEEPTEIDEPAEDEEIDEIEERFYKRPMRESRRIRVSKRALLENRRRANIRRKLQENDLRKNKFKIKKIGERVLDDEPLSESRRVVRRPARRLSEERVTNKLVPPVEHPALAKRKQKEVCENFNERSFDNLVNQLVNKNYKNIKAYKTTDVARRGNTLQVEGLIKFNSGNTKKTKFVFESVRNNSVGRLNVRYLGTNKDFTDKPNAMILRGKIGGNQLTCESLNYSFPIKTKALKEGKQKEVKGLITVK